MMDTLLNQVSLFDVMNEQEKLLLSQRLTVVNFEMGQTIVHTGELDELKELADGNEMNLGLLQTGEHFGESALLKTKRRTLRLEHRQSFSY